MSFAVPTLSLPYTPNTVLDVHVQSFGASLKGAVDPIIQKVKNILTSPLGQNSFGFVLGMGMHRIYGPLTEKIVKALGNFSMTAADPFSNQRLSFKILEAPFICLIGPILEEKLFRGRIHDVLNNKLHSFYLNHGFSNSNANLASRATSIFFTSVIFGLSHFSNAIMFWCSPVLFLPQVVATTIMGILFGLAKEFSGELHIPMGMHIGNNTLAWAYDLRCSL